MKQFLIVILSLMTAASVLAQTKTVTNKDLERFRLQRIEAEKELKEKYAEMGTTPEQVEREYRQRRAEMDQYSTQLKIWRITAENALIEQENARRQYDNSDDQPNFVNYGGIPYYGYSYGFYGNRNPLWYLRRLPPNMRTVQEYAIMYPNIGSVLNPRRNFRRFGKGFNFGGRPYIRFHSGAGIRIRASFGGGRGRF